ncbi:unnamed protein product [Amoebophrya sp. A120]|nr:unnamed protein product [Amoebophrya sp. A120]|eukprot:GSA120T00016944001.1
MIFQPNKQIMIGHMVVILNYWCRRCLEVLVFFPLVQMMKTGWPLVWSIMMAFDTPFFLALTTTTTSLTNYSGPGVILVVNAARPRQWSPDSRSSGDSSGQDLRWWSTGQRAASSGFTNQCGDRLATSSDIVPLNYEHFAQKFNTFKMNRILLFSRQIIAANAQLGQAEFMLSMTPEPSESLIGKIRDELEKVQQNFLLEYNFVAGREQHPPTVPSNDRAAAYTPQQMMRDAKLLRDWLQPLKSHQTEQFYSDGTGRGSGVSLFGYTSDVNWNGHPVCKLYQKIAEVSTVEHFIPAAASTGGGQMPVTGRGVNKSRVPPATALLGSSIFWQQKLAPFVEFRQNFYYGIRKVAEFNLESDVLARVRSIQNGLLVTEEQELLKSVGQNSSARGNRGQNYHAGSSPAAPRFPPLGTPRSSRP